MNSRYPNVTCALTPGDPVESRIAPLFWQHGEPAAVLREELQQMRAVGIRECVLESRPHPDYLGTGWWESVDAILDEADRLGMRVWFFDDAAYPSGFAYGRIRERYPHLLKVYLAQRPVDARGPLHGASFRIRAWLEADEQLVGVVAARRTSADGEAIDPSTLIDLTDRVSDGRLYWDVPDGWWRVFILVRTRRGGEDWTRDYLNPLLPEAVDAYLNEVHEAHFRRYADRFGKTIAGFFTDEPRFGNTGTYDAVLGEYPMVLPWSDDLLAELSNGWGGSFRSVLPALWNDAGDLSNRARYRFMDVVSRRFGANFTGRIGRWCHEHGVRLIGHIVEDNNAHARLGYGPGHFFRALQGQDMSGFDMVCQVWPGLTEGRVLTPFGFLDMSFFYWGLAKLASSCAHLDPRKGGLTMCELFGAYGWQLGLTGMKWLTDHACSRGANFLVPHAFSPKYPDPDCPPHFYARGANPQWRHFGIWSAYASRLCHLLSGGEHAAPVAVLYHAEAEWAGRCEHFHHAVGALARRQIDCDIVPIDLLVDEDVTQIGNGCFRVNRERFTCLIVPSAERLPLACLRRIVQLLQAGIRVVFTGDLPISASDCPLLPGELQTLRSHPGVSVCPVSELAASPVPAGLADTVVEPACPYLRVYRYRRGGMELLFCANEDPRLAVDAILQIRQSLDPLCYDAIDDTLGPIPFERSGQKVSVRLRIQPFSSLFVVFPDPAAAVRTNTEYMPMAGDLKEAATLEGPWRVSVAPAESNSGFSFWRSISGLCNLDACQDLRDFAGIIAYETMLPIADDTGKRWLDLGELHQVGEVFLDGRSMGVRICPPHRHFLGNPGLGEHCLRVEVTTTLVGRLGDNAFDRSMPQEPLGLLGPVRVLR